MATVKYLVGPLALLLASAIAQTCDTSGGGAAYTGKFKSLGCYNDSSVSILSNAKVSTVAMTPQYCADFCGARGYAYGGIEFTTWVHREEWSCTWRLIYVQAMFLWAETKLR
jgi:hypothetical protein